MWFEIIELDVWGNKEEGYTVNESFPTGTMIQLTQEELEDDQKLLEVLEEENMIKSPLGADQVEIDGDPEHRIHIDYEDMPLLDLSRVFPGEQGPGRPQVVVTRHQGLVDYLVEEGVIDEGVPVYDHADEETVRNKHVIGGLPHSLSCLTQYFTEVPFYVPNDLRGRELTADDVRKHAGKRTTYKVEKIASGGHPAATERMTSAV